MSSIRSKKQKFRELTDEEQNTLIASANFLQDGFFKLYFSDIPTLQEFLKIQLQNPNLTVVKIYTEKNLHNFYGRDVFLDVLCKSNEGYINVEMQCNIGEIDHVRRAVYHAACIMTRYEKKGDKNFTKIPKIVVLYITVVDFLKTGQTVVRTRRMIEGVDRPLDTGVDFVFANLEIKDGSDASHMLEMLQTCEKNERFPAMSDRIHYLKETEQGEHEMYAINNVAWEYGRTEGIKQGRSEGELNSIRALIKNKGYSVEEAMTILDISPKLRNGYAEKLRAM